MYSTHGILHGEYGELTSVPVLWGWGEVSILAKHLLQPYEFLQFLYKVYVHVDPLSWAVIDHYIKILYQTFDL